MSERELTIAVTQPNIDESQDLIYAQAFTQTEMGTTTVTPLKMSLLVPRDAKLHPAVLYFPGGGFTQADFHKFIDLRMQLARAGFVVASAEYRVIPNVFPDLLIDAKAALRFLRAHAAEFHIDIRRIGLLGDSAGGYLAQLTAVTAAQHHFSVGANLEQSESVQAVVSLYGISDLTTIGADFPAKIQRNHARSAAPEALLLNGVAFNDHWAKNIAENADLARQASPLDYVVKQLPPFLLMDGDRDKIVSPSQSQRMYTKLRRFKNEARLIHLVGAGHGTVQWHQAAVLDLITQWLCNKLVIED